MSRLNDALKQARQTQQNQPPAGLPPLTPATAKTTGGIGWFVPVTVGLLLIGAGLFIGLALFQPAPAPLPAPVVGAVEAPVAKPKPFESAPLRVAGAQTNATLKTDARPPARPPLKLQGIMMDPKRPWAIVSGHTVFTGDAVADFRVTEIRQQSVTLKKADGSLETLTLPE